jgi:histidyl-tRNA synthetase
LSEAIGGPATPGVGFGSGIERIVLGLKEQNIKPPDAVVPELLLAHFGGKTKQVAVQLAFQLRAAGFGARLAFARQRRSLKSQMREADRTGAQMVLIIGESEVADGEVTMRPLDGGEQIRIPLNDVAAWLRKRE